MSDKEVGSLSIEEYYIYMDAYTNKLKHEITLQRNAFLNATMNFNRKKGSPFIELFPEGNGQTQSITEEESTKLREELFKGQKIFVG